jgi:ribonuclease HI
MERDEAIAFTDGAASGNPGPGGWGAIVLRRNGEVIELGGGAALTTNNKMELTAAVRALQTLDEEAGPAALYTDSTYLIHGITRWVHGWRRNGWKTSTGGEVLNRDLWERLIALVAARGRTNPVHWRHVRGHAGVPGNERADAIAVAYSRGESIPLYRGPLEGYSVPLLELAPASAGPAPAAAPRERRPGTSNARGAKAYSYLSLVDGRAMRHATWTECERRVKGRSGARFKKAASRDDERAILRGWGLRGDEV